MIKLKYHQTGLAWLLLLTSFLYANPVKTGHISGYIHDNQQRPVSDVAVIAIPSNQGDISDANGLFSIENLKPGNYKLKIKHIGYKTKTIKQVLVQEDQVTDLGKIQLQQQIIEMEKVLVTATRTENQIFAVPNAINLVSAATIQRRNAKTSAEALREEAGVFVQKTHHGGGSVTLRGLSSNQILLLVDGVRLNNSTYRLGNHQYMTTVDNQGLQQIEVVRGPTSVLYGSDALGGTINLVPRQPEFTQADLAVHYRLFGRYATADQEKTWRGAMSVRHSRLAWTTGFTLKNYGDLRRGRNSDHPQLEKSTRDIYQDPTGFNAHDFDSRLVYGLSPAQTVTLAYQRSRQKNVPRYDKYENDGYLRWLYQPQDRDLVYLTYNSHLTGKAISQMRVSLSYQHQVEGREMQVAANKPLSREKDAVGTSGLAFELHSRLGQHHLTLGSDIYLDQVRSERFTIATANQPAVKEATSRYPDGAIYNSYGIFLQDEIRVRNRWTVIPGIRVSMFHTAFRLPKEMDTAGLFSRVEQNFKSITFSSGFIYRATEAIYLNANLAQGFRAPNLSDISKLGESKGNIYEVPNPDIKPEKMLSLDLGFKINAERLKASLSAYQSQIQDLLASADATFRQSSVLDLNGVLYKIKAKKNIGKAYIRGLESSLDYSLFSDFNLHADFTLTYGQNTTLSEPVGGIPPAFGRVQLSWIREAFSGEFYVRFASKQDRLSADDRDDPRIPAGGTPGWHTYNLRLGLQLKNWGELQLAVENLGDLNYREHGSGINGPGRNFIITLSSGI